MEYGRPLYFCLVFFSLYVFFLAYSQRSEIGCLSHFHTWCGLSVNSECMSATRGSLEIQDAKNRQKICHLCTIAQLCRPVSSRLRHVSTIIRNLLNINISSTIWWTSAHLGHRSKISTGFACWLHYFSDVTQQKPTKFWTTFGRLLDWYTIYTFSTACGCHL